MRERLHPLRAEPYTAAFGVTRKVGKMLPVINFEGGEYSVPDDYVGQTVWVRQPHELGDRHQLGGRWRDGSLVGHAAISW